MNRPTLSLPFLTVLCALSACSEEPEAPVETDQSATATGDILGGSISDDILPLEELRSQSPPAPRSTPAAGSRSSAESEPETAEPAPETPEAEPAVADPAPSVAPPLE